jgi:short-subunit dehydrogenase
LSDQAALRVGKNAVDRIVMSKCIVITGGSSGIGRALALFYAAQDVTLGLVGRNERRLQEVALCCREKGATVSVGLIDVRRREELEAWLFKFNDQTPVDLVIANAGVMGGAQEGEDIEGDQISRLILETNLLGVLNTVQPLLPRMIARCSGQIALMSSIAGFIPLPDAPSYGASKAAVLRYGLALRTALRGSGVKLSVICPGFITTAMTAQEYGWKPFEMSAERAAVIIADGLDRNRAVIAFPRFLAFATWIGGLLPERVRNVTERAFRFKVGRADEI